MSQATTWLTGLQKQNSFCMQTSSVMLKMKAAGALWEALG